MNFTQDELIKLSGLCGELDQAEAEVDTILIGLMDNREVFLEFLDLLKCPVDEFRDVLQDAPDNLTRAIQMLVAYVVGHVCKRMARNKLGI